MEQRQRVHHDVVGPQHAVGMGEDLARVGDEVAVRQHHAFRRALGAGREQHHRRLIGAQTLSAVIAGGIVGAQQAEGFVLAPDGLAEILEVDDLDFAPGGRLDGGQRLDEVVELRHADEPARGDDRADHARLDGRTQVFQARREVQQRRHPAVGVEPEHRDGEAVDVRQQHADVLGPPRAGGEFAAEHQRSQHQPFVGERTALLVFERYPLAPQPRHRGQQRAEQSKLAMAHVEGQRVERFHRGHGVRLKEGE
jgi:hypothetical protein